MMATLSRVLFAAMLTLALVACNRQPAQNQTQTEAPASAQQGAAPAPAQAANQPAPIPPLTELQVQRVDSVMLSRPLNAPDSIIIRVAGTVVSAGWTEPKLSPLEDPNGPPAIRVFSFVATSPPMPDDARAAAAVETELRVDALPPEVRTIRVVSATNAVSAPIVQ
jgi:hypothetical protein